MQLHLDDITPVQLQAVGFALANPEAILEIINAVAISTAVPQPQGQVEALTDGQATEPTEPTPNDVFGTQGTEPTPEEVFGTQGTEPTPGTNGAIIEPTETVDSAELDSQGFPWDERIHARTKTKITDGTWKLKRGVDQALVSQVRAESGQVSNTESVPPQEPTPSVFAGSDAQHAGPQAHVIDFPTLMGKITTGIGSRSFTPAQVSQILNNYGIASTGELGNHVDKFADIHAELEALGYANATA